MKIPNASHKKRLLPFIIAFILFSSASTRRVTAPSETTIYVEPLKVIGKPGEVFTVDINVANVIDLYAYEFKLGFEPHMNVISTTNVDEGDFLKKEGNTAFAKKIDNFRGYVKVGCTLLGLESGVSGNGTLVTIEFSVLDVGDSVLSLYDTVLLDSALSPIDHAVEGGYFSTPAIADLVRRGAWPKRHQFSITKDKDGVQTLYGMVRNLGDGNCYVRVKFEVVDESGQPIETFLAKNTINGVEIRLTPGNVTTLSVNLWETRDKAWVPGKYYVKSTCSYSAGHTVWESGAKIKTLRFVVVP